MVLFASGAVGDASPARLKASSQSKSAEALGLALAGDLLTALPSARFHREIEVGNLWLAVDLPPVRLPFFAAKLRFSPLATWWIASRQTHLHALRLGPAVLVGFPGDYAGHLANKLDAATLDRGVSTVSTSFDGDFRGYLVSEAVFRGRSCYETRWMSFYGPWLGDYFNDVARRMVARLTDGPTVSSSPSMIPNDLAPRLSLGVLIATALVIGWRRRGEVHAIVSRSGFLGVAVASAVVIGFTIDPELVDWGKFGLPLWLRMAGLPLGHVALAQSKSRATGRMAWLLGISCGLLASSWIVVLLCVRAAIKGGFARPIEVELSSRPHPLAVSPPLQAQKL